MRDVVGVDGPTDNPTKTGESSYAQRTKVTKMTLTSREHRPEDWSQLRDIILNAKNSSSSSIAWLMTSARMAMDRPQYRYLIATEYCFTNRI